MKQILFGLLMLLATASAAFADNTPGTTTLPDGDCVRVTQNDGGIMIIDIADLCRVAPALGLTQDQYTAIENCCIIVLIGCCDDSGDHVVTVTNTDTGQTASFPVCK